MAYVAVAKALFEYSAQDPETELSFKEDQILYVIEKEDDDWWKAKLKGDSGASEGAIGLIPQTYVEEIPPMNDTRAIYAYEQTSPEELSMDEDAVLQVFSVEEEWLLVRIGFTGRLGFVPRTYCEVMDEAREVDVEDAAQTNADVEEARQQEEEDDRRREVAEKQRQLKLKDKVETWGISEMEGKKKKKGTLGVGNGAVFFASDTDKMTPVKQYAITELSLVSQPSSKLLELTISSLSEPLIFHCGSSDTAKAIIAKLESSKTAAGEALEMDEADVGGAISDEDETPAAAAEPKAVRWAPEPEPTTPGGGAETANVLYDFDAQGEDELTVHENDVVTVVDKENDEWWLVRHANGQEGVVPAQYVQIHDGSAAAAPEPDTNGNDSDDDRRRVEEVAAAAASVEAERQKERERKADQRRAIERAAREKQQQEEEDRQMALKLENNEREKRERRERRREEETRRKREEDSEKRREEARRLEPPKISKRPSAQNVAAAAASLPTRGHRAPERPPDNNRPREPNPARTRMWSDKSGQFKVEAEYLGLNGNKIRLHKLNGVIIEVPLEKMSNDDAQMVKRHQARKAKQREALDDDDVPLGQSPAAASRSERGARQEEPIPAAAMEMPKQRKPRFDWFAFFLEAGCDIDDCTRYAANFERDRMDESILEELDAGTLRSLGLKEGDILRVKKSLNVRFAKKTPEQSEQIKSDEDYARQLQEHENSGGKGPAPQPAQSLFTGPGGKLANNTRRGRPDKKSSTGPESVDPSALTAASDALSRTTIKSPTPPPVPSPVAEKPQPPPVLIGFDDDAWTIKPSTSKPASPAPPPTTLATSPSNLNGTDALLAQIQGLRPPSVNVSQNNTGNALGRGTSSPVQSNQTGSSGFGGPSAYGLGAQNANQSMQQMMNGPRGPVAPVASNEALLNPLQPSQTGMFVPTRGSPLSAMNPQATGFPQQQTGFQGGFQQQQQQPMMMQPTGYAAGFQQAYGGVQPNVTGYQGFQQPQSAFNTIASIGPPQQPQNPDKFAPSNIFAAMKKSEFGRPEDQNPQDSNKYDALRPLTTGYNGGPGMVPQQTGYGMMPQMTGFAPQGGQMGMGGGMGMGMGQTPYGQSPYGQQNQYGGQYR